MNEKSIDECYSLEDPQEPFQQGDILLFPGNKDCEKYGVIVTADCDLAQNKYGEFISYCSILTLQEYVEFYLLKKKFDTLLENEKSKLIKTFKTNLNVTVDEVVLSDLLEKDKSELTKFIKDQKTLDAFLVYKSDSEKKKITYSDYVSISNYLNNSPKKLPAFIQDLESQILDKLPGDKYFINDLPIRENSNFGYVVNLRRIKEIKAEEIALQYLPNLNQTVRIGRLHSPLKQQLSQRLAAMFSDIGVPSENETFRKECVLSELQGVLK